VDKFGDELMFDMHVDLEADDIAEGVPSALRCRSRKPRLPLHQARLEAYTREIDDSIEDTYLQHDLERHPSAQAWKGQVRFSFPFLLSVRYIYIYIYSVC